MFGRLIGGWIARRGSQVVLQAAASSLPKLTAEEFTQVFPVTLPSTVYVYASHARVTIRQQQSLQVALHGTLHGAFGWQIVAEQDHSGVYIVAKQKPVIGALSSASFTLIIPSAIRLVAELTPGALLLEDVHGRLEIPPLVNP
jgi:hypothetical protein